MPSKILTLNKFPSILHLSGTFNPHESLEDPSECTPCSAGKFCNESGLSAPAGDCSAGYLCVSGATVPGPNDGVNGPCPAGLYCLEGR